MLKSFSQKGNFVPTPSKKLLAAKQITSTLDDCEKRNYDLFHIMYTVFILVIQASMDIWYANYQGQNSFGYPF